MTDSVTFCNNNSDFPSYVKLDDDGLPKTYQDPYDSDTEFSEMEEDLPRGEIVYVSGSDTEVSEDESCQSPALALAVRGIDGSISTSPPMGPRNSIKRTREEDETPDRSAAPPPTTKRARMSEDFAWKRVLEFTANPATREPEDRINEAVPWTDDEEEEDAPRAIVMNKTSHKAFYDHNKDTEVELGWTTNESSDESSNEDEDSF